MLTTKTITKHNFEINFFQTNEIDLILLTEFTRYKNIRAFKVFKNQVTSNRFILSPKKSKLNNNKFI